MPHFPQELRGVMARKAAQEVLLKVGMLGPFGIDPVPGQPVCART